MRKISMFDGMASKKPAQSLSQGGCRIGLVFSTILVLCHAHGQETDEQPVRDLAASLLSSKAASSSAASCSFTLARPSNTCSGPGAIEDSLEVRGDGRIRFLRFRSFAESNLHNPGEFQSGTDQKRWTDLLNRLGGLNWVMSPSSPPMPMPSHSDTHRRILLRDGKTAAEYSLSGKIPIVQVAVRNVFSHLESLTHRATDTVWSLGIVVTGIQARGGELVVSGSWNLSGRSGIEIKMPGKGDGENQCGKVALEGYRTARGSADSSRLPGEVKTVRMAKDTGFSGTWTPISPGKSIPFNFRFDAPGNKGYRGKLVMAGFQVRTRSLRNPIPIALYSSQFDY